MTWCMGRFISSSSSDNLRLVMGYDSPALVNILFDCLGSHCMAISGFMDTLDGALARYFVFS